MRISDNLTSEDLDSNKKELADSICLYAQRETFSDMVSSNKGYRPKSDEISSHFDTLIPKLKDHFKNKIQTI